MNLDSGKLFTKTFRDKVGFRYYEMRAEEYSGLMIRI